MAVYGEVYGGTIGILMDGTNLFGETVFVGAGGSATGAINGIELMATGCQVTNFGTIMGQYAVLIAGDSPHIVNQGTISSVYSGTAITITQSASGLRQPALTEIARRRGTFGCRRAS